MTEPFDPYRQWLGIEETSRPLDHYRLLGLAQFESDSQQIAHAADVAMAKVRKIRPGEHIADWGRLLDQIGAVKVCLLDPSSKTAYDASLRGGSAPAAAPATAVRPLAAAPQVALPPSMESTWPGGSPPQSPGASQGLSLTGLPAAGLPTAGLPTAGLPTAGLPTAGLPTAGSSAAGSSAAGLPAAGLPQTGFPAAGGGGELGTAFPGSAPASPQVPSSSPSPVFPGSVPAPGGGAVARPLSESPWSSNPVPMSPGGGVPVQPGQGGSRPLPVATAVPAPQPSGGQGGGTVSSAFPSAGAAPFPQGPTPDAFSGSSATSREAAPRKRSPQQQVTTIATVILSCVVVFLVMLLLTQGGREEPEPATPPPMREDTAPKEPEDVEPFAPAAVPPATDRAPAPQAEQPGTPSPPNSPSEQPVVPEEPASAGNTGAAVAPPEPAGGGNPATVPMDGTGPPKPEPATRPEPAIQPEPATETNPAPAETDPMMGSSPPPTSEDAPPIDPMESPAPTVPSTPPGMSAQGATLELALSNVRFSMSERDLGGARAHLDLARKIASTDEQKHAVERLTTVLDHLTEFWKGMHKAAEAIQSGTELAVKDTVVIVVESGPDALILRAAGRNLNYRVEELPGALVMAVAESWFDKSASSKLLMGTFLCFDGKGREDMGRKMLADAAAGGLDVKPFLEELKAGGSGVDVGQTRSGAAAKPGAGPAGSARPALQIDEDALRQARQSVRKTFAAEFQAATTPPAKEDLARKLISQAGQAGDTPDVQVVMLQEAQRLAVESGKVDLALETAESLVQLGVASSLPLKADVLEQLAKTARGANSNRQIAQAAIELIPKAADARNRADAVRLAEVALTAARGSNNAVLMRQAAAVKQQIEAMPKK